MRAYHEGKGIKGSTFYDARATRASNRLALTTSFGLEMGGAKNP